ncbi:2S albumin [Bienertia sinuspersici]
MAKNFQQLLLATLAASLLLISAFKTAHAEARLSSRCEQWEKKEQCRQHINSEMEVMMFPNSGNQVCCLKECCEMLQIMEEECVCEVLEGIAEEETECTKGRDPELENAVLRKAMQLPTRCRISTRCKPTVGKIKLIS